MMEFLPPLPVVSAPPVCATTPVVDVSPMLVERVQPAAPVVENVAPVTAVTCAAPAPVVEDIAPAPATTFTEHGLVDKFNFPAPAATCAAPAPVVDCIAGPVVEYIAPALVDFLQRLLP